MDLRVKIVVVVFFKHGFGEGEFGPRLLESLNQSQAIHLAIPLFAKHLTYANNSTFNSRVCRIKPGLESRPFSLSLGNPQY